MQINREDMLELTRRMTIKRNCFSRIAGAYIDREGYIDGTFNTNFLNLTVQEKEKNLAIAKKVIFSETNAEVRGYRFQPEDKGSGSLWQLLQGINSCGLKNDALLEIFYDKIVAQSTAMQLDMCRDHALIHGKMRNEPDKHADQRTTKIMKEVYDLILQKIHMQKEWAIMVFSGCYDVPLKGTDHAWQGESEEVYQFLITAVCPLVGEYEPGEPEAGFLFPAFTNRSSDSNHVIVFRKKDGNSRP